MSTTSERFGVKEKIELFFIDEDFYNKSQTVMGNLYVSGKYERFDWGFVKCLLKEGKIVSIRLPTETELKWVTYHFRRVQKTLSPLFHPAFY